jgi:pimeloyl-ACP methyl ester carboxylesterase
MSIRHAGVVVVAGRTSTEDRVLRLRDGRQLGYAEYGDRAGRPLIALHGTPGSRLMLRVADEQARRLGIHLIAPDRPGFGLSDPKPGRRLLDWPDDLAELADALGIGRFALVGISGGGPYAGACARRLPVRLASVGIVSGLGPLSDPAILRGLKREHRLSIGLARNAPWLLHALAALARRRWNNHPETLFARLRTRMPAVDQAIIGRPEVQANLVLSFREAFRRGGRAVAEELHLFTHPWGFRLEEVSVPVRLWHGDADTVVPVGMAHLQARALPQSRLEIRKGAGHYWFFDHIEMLLRAVSFPTGDAD